MTRDGHSLVELIIAVMIVAALVCIAVPRLPFEAVHRAKAEAVARKITMDLRLTRSRAILNALQNPAGCALVMVGLAPYDRYQLVDLGDASVVADHELPSEVSCTGGRRFEFSPLGSLTEDSDTEIQVSSDGRTWTVTVLSATGMVKCL